MEEGKPSSSTITAAMNRAAHLFLDDEPRIFRDDFAPGFCDLHNEAELKKALDALYKQFQRGNTAKFAGINR